MDASRPRFLRQRTDSDLRTQVLRIAENGAVMTTCSSPCLTFLVGELRWSDCEPNCLHFFAGNGDGLADAHSVRFDAVEWVGATLRFLRRGQFVGSLAPIDEADVGDRDDYRVGWQIWKQVAPLKASQIDEVFDTLDRLDQTA